MAAAAAESSSLEDSSTKIQKLKFHNEELIKLVKSLGLELDEHLALLRNLDNGIFGENRSIECLQQILAENEAEFKAEENEINELRLEEEHLKSKINELRLVLECDVGGMNLELPPRRKFLMLKWMEIIT